MSDGHNQDLEPNRSSLERSCSEPSRPSVSEISPWSSDCSAESSGDESAKSFVDFKSPSFSPTLALKCQASDVVPEANTAKKYLNLQQYSKAVKSPSKSPRKDVSHLKKVALQDLETKKASLTLIGSEPQPSTSAEEPFYPIPGRRFLPHQLPVFRPRKEHPNTITLMNTVEGPLSVLQRVLKNKTRIKIWNRTDVGFRGFLTGFVDAFDKHWNMVLRDVDEKFVRKRLTKFPVLGESKEGTLEGNDNDGAVSSSFIRLKNYLSQNDAKKRTGPAPKATKSSYKNKRSSNMSSKGIGLKSKTIYVGDMDALSICRTGLENLSLRSDSHHHDQSSKNKETCWSLKPDIVQCHQSGSGGSEESSISAAVPIQQNISRTSLKKKSLTVFKMPYEDSFGFTVVAQTAKYELVERHVGQVLLMGNDIVFIETSGC